MSKSIGLIGCGTIGSELAFAIDNGTVKNASIAVLFDSISNVAESLRSKLRNNNPSTFSDFTKFIFSTNFDNTDIIVEAASQIAVTNYSKKLAERGKTLMIMSVGALADLHFLSELLEVASKNRSHIYVPTGAIAGIDAIRSAKHFLDSVILTTTKNPKSLAGAPYFNMAGIDAYSITEKTVIYEGSAAEAVKKFPSNINVAAVLSLAGLGIEKTKVKIIADPYIYINQHEITAKGAFGEMSIVVRNTPSPHNPKTSFLAALSAIECLRSICNSDIRIGT
jgi:aspartate dehydrogenase